MAEKDINEGFSTLEDTSEEVLRAGTAEESLILKLEIGSSIQDLIIYENEDPEEAVSKFCDLHKLTPEIAKVLLVKVFENLLSKQPTEKNHSKQPRFVKKGNFIKKEVDQRGKSAMRATQSRLSPCRSDEGQFHESPVVRNKFRLESGARLLAKPRPQSNRIIKQFVPTQLSRSDVVDLNCSKPTLMTTGDKNFNEIDRKPGKISASEKKPFSSTSKINTLASSSCFSKLIPGNDKTVQNNSKKLFSDEQSQTILNRIRFLKIKKLFDLIDQDRCGFITKENFSNLSDTSLLRALRPILEEITLKSLKLCLGEFESKVDMLLTRISNNERMLILGVKN